MARIFKLLALACLLLLFGAAIISSQSTMVSVAAPGQATSPATKAATTSATSAASFSGTQAPTMAATISGATGNTFTGCNGLPSHAALVAALKQARAQANGGFNLDMWATVVNRDGMVCAVAFTGKSRGDQWPGSRVISAQKANTANAFSLPGLALSTANLYSAVQPGGSLFGLQESNPVDPAVAYGGNANNYGLENDPMVGKHIGGINVFGGGLALYSGNKTIVGGLGVSGDSSCADHNIAWETRYYLGLDNIPGGVSPAKDDNIVYDITIDNGGRMSSPSGWGHPACSQDATKVAKDLASKFPIGHKR